MSEETPRMIVVPERPPNFEAILAAFPGAANPGVIFCYGRFVYNPSGAVISPALHAHESVHSRSQGDDPKGWWWRYIDDAKFRFDEELPAHAAEYAVASRGLSRPGRRQELRQIAGRLASALYGRMVRVDVAKRLILDLVPAGDYPLREST